MPLMPAELPTEILELITDESRHNLRTLINCSTANRVFVARSRVHLFRKITFLPPLTSRKYSMYPTGPTRCDRFAELLKSNPDLAYHVQEIDIVEGGHPQHITWWISQSTSLLPILRRLHNLQSFALRCGYYSTEWSDVLREALSICVHHPSIDSVELSGLAVRGEGAFGEEDAAGVEGLFPIFSGVERTLRNLRISNLSLSHSPIVPPQHLPLQVDTLDVTFHENMEGSFINLLLTSPPLITMGVLRRLRLTVCHNDLQLIGKWFQACADSLEEVELVLTSKWSLGPLQVTDSMLDHHFVPTPHIRLARFVMDDPRCTPKVAMIIRMLRASSISKIRFSLNGRRGSFESLDEDEWSALNNIITPGLFPRLDTIQIESGKSPLVSSSKLEIRQWLRDLDTTFRLILCCATRHVKEYRDILYWSWMGDLRDIDQVTIESKK